MQGTLDLLLLKLLALEPLHGWAIGSLYPALHKLEQSGWIKAEWRNTEKNRRAKFYSLTPLGRTRLAKETANWDRLSAAISGIVRLTEA
jgi:DNA-binding PadR family transcriptional regulator